ncbi:MAG: DUF881 domain-containing protein [Clostridiaceae bacterium]|nr:DUF881 domain-containing protein [Clostridiaceae bacterium]
MKKGSNFIFFLIYIFLGIIIALQYRSTLYTKNEKTESFLSIEKLIAQLDQEKKIEEELKLQAEEFNHRKEEYLMSYIQINDDIRLKFLWEELNALKRMAGLTDVQGPGLVIKLEDAPERKSDRPDRHIIHDGDIRVLMNELKKAGAQAISINGERIIATSEQVCAGPTIRVNMDRYSAPYIIHVIGPMEQLYESIINCERVVLMQKEGIQVSITKSGRVLVPKYGKDPAKAISMLKVVE